MANSQETNDPAALANGGMTGLLDLLLDPAMEAGLAALGGSDSLLAGMIRYHLGLVNVDFVPVHAGEIDRGKRIRPGVALLACGAVGGDSRVAAPLAASVELLHNFTLIHDDIQDHSPTRRHRPTVWSHWGTGQAINAGDALFAAAHLSLYHLRTTGVEAERILLLADAFERMTINIVEGQVQDLGFEGRDDITPDAYLQMIGGKTAAILRYSAWAGALLGGADTGHADAFAGFGWALGLGFQIQDDLLGIWGSRDLTGKAAADDIRRRKQSLPILLLRAEASAADCATLDRLYAQPEIDEPGTAEVLRLLERYQIRSKVETVIAQYHDEARSALHDATNGQDTAAQTALVALVEQLAGRTG